MVHRHNNPFWTWLADDRLKLGLICDGFHLPPDLIRVAFAVKGAENIFMVSDASPDSGRPPGDYGDFVIEENGKCWVPEEDILSGNWFQADRCVEVLCSLGWTLADALRQQCIIPARIIGIDEPRIAPGELAEFVLSRWTGEKLILEQIVAAGEELLTTPAETTSVWDD